MNDEEIERKLRRFRIVEPPPTLRTTIVERSGGPVVSASAWMPTAAALIAAAVLYWLSAYERAAVRFSVDQAAARARRNIELVARSLGGGPQSFLVAKTVVLLDEPKRGDRAMTDRTVDRFAVRPKFLAWLTLAIALPVLAHAAWDYTEARRLRARVDAIAAKGEPTSIDQVRPVRQLTDTGKRGGAPVSRCRSARIRLESKRVRRAWPRRATS